jgi:hypothetical protein
MASYFPQTPEMARVIALSLDMELLDISIRNNNNCGAVQRQLARVSLQGHC